MADKKVTNVDALAVAQAARRASRTLAVAPRDKKDAALIGMARRLSDHAGEILEANQQDLKAAVEVNLPENMVARLRFDETKILSRQRSLQKIAELPDPVGQAIRSEIRPNGLSVDRVRVPMGVILMVYEARPHVTVNAGAFCLKSGNAAILRGGSEAKRCNALLGRLWQESLDEAGLPVKAIQVISGDHQFIHELLELDQYIDLVIPRGGKRLIEAVAERSRIPVIKHYEGICHVYLDEIDDLLPSAVSIVLDSKCLMPEVCNAAETLLVSRRAASHLATVVSALREQGVALRGCEEARQFDPRLEPASEEDWKTEYLDMVFSVRVVDGVSEAIEHINRYGSHHTDTIVTSNTAHAEQFVAGVDSAVVLVNASTMFCDGESLGMGAEIGISTDKLHARGPMGLEELTTYKFVIHGGGHVMGTWTKRQEATSP
ncbi:MAG: glutamate-5-semialdehyde dehydrogenase [Pirellulales bacterium]|nr:glutamate-5-semialdehyde dehydrogenase [Pirellulales bacterium]